MLRQARERLPNCTFVEGDLATWMPPEGTDLLFGNAVFQWVPDHPAVLRRLLERLPEGGVLAVQMPDNTDEPALALDARGRDNRPVGRGDRECAAQRATICRHRRPTTICCGRSAAHLDIWHTHYNHVMAGPRRRGRMVQGLGACGRSCPCSTARCASNFSPPIPSAIARAYPARYDGKVMLNFRGCSSWRCARQDGLGRSPGRHCRDHMDALINRPPLFAFTRTLLAIGPVSPMSST